MSTARQPRKKNTKSQSRPQAGGRAVPVQQSRADRRVQERTQRKQQRTGQGSGPAVTTIVGAIVTAVIVLAIAGYVLNQMNSTSHSKGAALAVASDYNPATNLLKVGSKAPNFTLKGADGKTYSLASQKGHPVFLEFFAIWCPICHGEAPIMHKLAATYVPKGVRVWSILSNPYGSDYETSGEQDLSPATKSDMTWYHNSFNVNYPQLIDPHFSTVNRYGIGAYPGIYMIDKNGIIRFAHEGHEDYSVLAPKVSALLK